MNKIIETVLSNSEAKATDYFELINVFDYSALSVMRDGNTIISMGINEFMPFGDSLELRQKCTETHYTINGSEIKTISGRMLEDTDTFLIEVSMTDDSKVCICIYHTDTNEKIEKFEHYTEYDVYSLKEYLENDEHKPLMVIMRDAFGIDTRFNSVKECVLKGQEEFRYTLQIVSERVASIEFPLVDDSCN